MPTVVKFAVQDIKPVQHLKYGLHTVILKDNEREYSWAPKWDDLHNIYMVAALVEILNEGKKEDLLKFIHKSSQLITTVVDEATLRLTGVDLRSKETSLPDLLQILKDRHQS